MQNTNITFCILFRVMILISSKCNSAKLTALSIARVKDKLVNRHIELVKCLSYLKMFSSYVSMFTLIEKAYKLLSYN